MKYRNTQEQIRVVMVGRNPLSSAFFEGIENGTFAVLFNGFWIYPQVLLEGSKLHPTNPYAASKAAAECIVTSYWQSFKVRSYLACKDLFSPCLQ